MTDRPSILVIDDKTDNFDVIQILLGKDDYQLHYASSGHRALARMDRLQPDLILLDLMMPVLDGIEVCHLIKASIDWQSVPIIMISAIIDRSQIERCLSAGANDFIPKPVKRIELLTKVSSCLYLSAGLARTV
jgi:CheY-like chemotaxis protein